MREFATGSTTSSSVIELMSSHISDVFQAVFNLEIISTKFADAFVVNFLSSKIQSFVPTSAFVSPVATDAVEFEAYSVIVIDVLTTLFSLTKHLNLYEVDGLTGRKYIFTSPIVGTRVAADGLIDTQARPVAFVVDSFNVLAHVLVTAVSNSALHEFATTSKCHPYFSSSIQLSVVTAISPVALSILISSPHCEERVVVVVVQAVQYLNLHHLSGGGILFCIID